MRLSKIIYGRIRLQIQTDPKIVKVSGDTDF